MHTLEPELRTLHAEGAIDDATASRALARDRGEVFSLNPELRATLYAGVLLVMSGVGIILARNLDRIGPLVIVLAIALVAVACGVPAVRARRAGRPLTVAADYLLLLAVLLVSADLAYAERQFTLLGPLWSWHLLLLADFPRGHCLRICLPARARGVTRGTRRLVRRRRHARRRASFFRLDAGARCPRTRAARR